MMYSSIVVGTDGSPAARSAVTRAGEIARRCGVDEVHVVAGYRPISSAELQQLARDVPSEYVEALVSDAPGQNLVDDATHILRRDGLTVDGHAVPASGAEAVLDVAEEVDADLIVVGARGHGVGHRFLHGSVASKVAHHATCDVLIVQPAEPAGRPGS